MEGDTRKFIVTYKKQMTVNSSQLKELKNADNVSEIVVFEEVTKHNIDKFILQQKKDNLGVTIFVTLFGWIFIVLAIYYGIIHFLLITLVTLIFYIPLLREKCNVNIGDYMR